MLSELVDHGDTVTLVPQSGIQFIEYGLDMDAAPRFAAGFRERVVDAPGGGDGRAEYELLQAEGGEGSGGGVGGAAGGGGGGGEGAYDVSRDRALEAFLGRWFPVPFLRIKPERDANGDEIYDAGPTNWARCRIVESRAAYGDARATHRVVFALDTALLERRENRPYVAPDAGDAASGRTFRMAHRFDDVGAFLSRSGAAGDQSWATQWLERLFHDHLRARRPNRAFNPAELEHRVEHLARYITLLGFLAEAVRPAAVRLVDTVSADPRVAPIDVDLVLDIGNSRSCGLLIQSFPNDTSVNLNNSMVLELRDLAEPSLAYREPFESHVELVPARFGPEDVNARSGRPRAFLWPSPVRLGPEAARYRSLSEGTEAVTGLSSPKRYLWDTAPSPQAWQFRRPDGHAAQPQIELTLPRYLNNSGDVLTVLERRDGARRLGVKGRDLAPLDAMRFSRSSHFTFMVLEIVAQAMMMINAPAVRRRNREKDSPRRLRSIVMTVPTAMPVHEQRILRARAESAIELMWQVMGWRDDTPGVPPRPALTTEWDEASSVHLVYLYNEIAQKVQGIEAFMRLVGTPRPRPAGTLGASTNGASTNGTGTNWAATNGSGNATEATEAAPSVRVASVDIGGGTTDLMITTYHHVGNRALVPDQNFREGFRRAGDELLKLVVDRVVLPAVARHLTEHGVPGARDTLREAFGDDSPNMSETQRHMRRQFVQRVLKPVALGVLADREDGRDEGHTADARPLASFLPAHDAVLAAPNPILAYLTDRLPGAGGIDLGEASVTVDDATIEACVADVFASIFDGIAEAVHRFGADVVLVTGRPSCQPAVVHLLRERLGVPADRVMAMRDLRVGNWYPFRKAAGSTIEDPKTTAVVGGMLCSLAQGKLTNLTVDTGAMVMRSTARFVGEIDTNGRIDGDKVYFRDDRPDEPRREEFEMAYLSPVRIGYRQLARPDWVAAPLYYLRMRPGGGSAPKIPVRVTIGRHGGEAQQGDERELVVEDEANAEEFCVEDAEDAEGTPVRGLMELTFNTSPLGSEGTYWLDSGILTVR